jgi:PKD repeat protein
LIDGLEVEFIDTTYAQPTRVIWTFGDGWGSMNPYPTHKYENSGTYRVVMRAYDEYGHSNMVETLITVNLGPSTPLEHTDTGWSMYWNNDTVISVSAVGLLISGAISLVSTWYMPTIPIVTKKARRLYGVLAILAGMYFFIFVKGIVNVGVFG